MKKSKKLLIYGLTLGVLGVCLTGCTIKLDDDEVEKLQETIKSVKIESDETKDSDVVEYEKIELDDDNTIGNSQIEKNDVENNQVAFIDSAPVQDGLYGYLNVFAYNDEGEIVWKYTTQKVSLTEWGCNSDYIGAEYGGVYVMDNGKLVVLSAKNGDLLCESKEIVSAGRCFALAGDNDVFEAVFVYSSVENVLYEFDTSDGRLVKKLDLNEKYNVDPTDLMEMTFEKKDIFDGDSYVETKSYLTIVAYEGEDEVANKVIVDVNDFSYEIIENN